MNFTENEELLTITDDNIQKAVTDWCFRKEEARTNYGDIKDWDTSNVTDMSLLFMELYQFNDDISNWNVSKVTDMSRMFWKATSFNQPLGNWERKNDANEEISTLKHVTDMEHMFYKAKAFNQDLKSWNLNEVIFPELNNPQNTNDKFKLEFHIFPGASNMEKYNYPLLGNEKEGFDKITVFNGVMKNSVADTNPNTTSNFKKTRQDAFEIMMERIKAEEKKTDWEYEGAYRFLGGKKRKTMKKKPKRRKTVKRRKSKRKINKKVGKTNNTKRPKL